MTAVLGVGMFVGSLISIRLAKKVPLHRMIIISFFLCGATHVLQAIVTQIVPFMALYLVFALSVPLCNVAFFGWLAQVTEPKMMGRVQALIQPLMMITFIAMQGLIAFAFPERLSIEAIYCMVAAAELLLALYYLLSLPSLAHKQALKNLEKAGQPLVT
jgi:DHA3 family macrolide efflux protein-like MFS transporter